MTEPISSGVRRGYAMGSVATGSFATVPGLLLLPYLTDTLGVAAAVAGAIVFFPKAWDVLFNPIAGRISDRHQSPRGRRRPFLLWGGIALALSFALIFSGPLEPTLVAGLWVFFMFWAAGTAFAFYQVPYVAMPAEITLNYDERTRIMTWRVIVLALAILISGATAPLVVNAVGGTSGYRVMGWYIAVIILIGISGSYFGTRKAPDYGVAPASASFKEQLKIVAVDKNFRTLLATFVIQAVGVGAMLAGVAYMSKDVLNNPGATTILFVAFVGPAILFTPLWERVANKRGKKFGYYAASFVFIVGTLALALSSANRVYVAYGAAALVGIAYAGLQVFPLAMLPDVASADAARTGENRVGVFTGIWTAGETLGMATGPGIYAIVLALGGYVSSTSGDAAQPDSAVQAIVFGMSLLPAVLVALSLLALNKYTERKTDEVR